MAFIKTSVILIWGGTNAGIPAGWTRETGLDSKFPKGTADATNPNTTGGAATHTHDTDANHGHTMDSHTHTYTLAAATNFSVGSSATAGDSAILGHTHTGTSGVASGGSLDSIAATYASFSSNPPYYNVIFIKPSAETNLVPSNVLALYDNSLIPTGFSFCDGTSSTPDLRNKYLMGAGTGADAGTTGGSFTNVHDLTHTHTVSAHNHADSTSTTYTGDHRSGGTGAVTGTHSHTTSIANATATLTDTVSLTTSETVEPAYTKLIPIKNTSGGDKALPLGTVALFLGDLNTIPNGWTLCNGGSGTKDMRGRHLKCANATTEGGNTGGSNTHTHASQTHTHTGVAHNHTGSHSAHTTNTTRNGTDDGLHNADATSVHAVNVANSTAVYATGSTSAASSNNEPEYRTVAFIKRVQLGTPLFILSAFM